jgi:type II secretory pathway pseudopilin PulG
MMPQKEAKLARRRRRFGFTLLQLIVVIAIMGVLAALSFGYLGRARARARVATCDAHLKAIAMALDTYRQEEKHYPASLQELADRHLVDADVLRCPADPDPNSAGYGEYYILRQARGDDDRPIVVCPLHESRETQIKQIGVQAFAGRYTKQYAAVSATLSQANAATVQEPGGQAISGAPGMTLRGGDRIRTGAAGLAVITFADGSTATLNENADVTVLQSFLDSQVSSSTLYTLVRQVAGTAVYAVHHGSKFDVATPTATAGARGTKFQITITSTDGEPATELKVLEGVVAFNNTRQGTLAQPGDTVDGTLDKLLKGLLGGLL